MTPDITKIGKQNFDTLAAIQKQVLDALAKANQEWIDCANQEAKLASHSCPEGNDRQVNP
jgi:hypothetical protein